MRQVLEAKKTSLELERRKSIKISKGFLFLFGLLFIILFSNVYYFKNAMILNNPEPFFIAMPILAGLSLIMRYQGNEDRVFLNIMESLELVDKGQTDPEVRKQAAKKLEDATNKLERLLGLDTSRVRLLWYSKVKEVEKEFIRKLKYRAVPALRGGILGSIRTNGTIHMLEQIARVFIEQDIGQMKVVNNLLEAYTEIQPNGKDKSSLIYFSRLRTGKIGSLIIILIIGFTSISIISFTYCLFTIHNFIDLISDPKFFILGGLAASALISPFFPRVKDTSHNF